MQVQCIFLTEYLKTQRLFKERLWQWYFKMFKFRKSVGHKMSLYLKSRLWSGVEVKHVARGGRCGGVWADGDTSLRLAEGGRVEELGGPLEVVSFWKGFSHSVQTDCDSLDGGKMQV